MRPVVVDPGISFAQLIDEATRHEGPAGRKTVIDTDHRQATTGEAGPHPCRTPAVPGFGRHGPACIGVILEGEVGG
jgi:hypothetical protein